MPAPPAVPAQAPALGIFDSGLGGLSVLRALRTIVPQVPTMYAADSAWAPYGERSDSEIRSRSLQVARALVDGGASTLVVACNTATAMAVVELRNRWPQRSIIGVEPGLRPALAATRSGRVGVMATEATLRSARFATLLERLHQEAQAAQQRPLHVHLQACPGLAAAIERGDLECPDLARQVAHWCALLRRAEVDTVVLGCTHYPFVAALIARELGPDVLLIDTAEAVARQVARRWCDDRVAEVVTQPGAPVDPPEAVERRAPTRYLGSGDLAGLRHAVTHWLGESDPDVARLAC